MRLFFRIHSFQSLRSDCKFDELRKSDNYYLTAGLEFWIIMETALTNREVDHLDSNVQKFRNPIPNIRFISQKRFSTIPTLSDLVVLIQV